jgi:hypothetical protein
MQVQQGPNHQARPQGVSLRDKKDVFAAMSWRLRDWREQRTFGGEQESWTNL